MADTGWVIAGSGTSDDTVGTEPWVNPGNITAEDGSYADANNASKNEQTEYIKGSNFGLSVPAGATIDGIELRGRLKCTGAGTPRITHAVIEHPTSGFGTDQESDETIIETDWAYFVYGGSTNLHGLSWTAADVNSASFGAAFSANVYGVSSGGNPECDAIWVKVYYTESTAELTASDLTIGSPALGTPALSIVVGLTATSLAVSSPALDTPTISQGHVLTADDLAVSSPALASPDFSQTHSLGADALEVNAPTRGSPALGQIHALDGDGLAVNSPVVGAPAIGQSHPLSAANLAASSPVLGEPTIGQAHALTATALALSSPAVGTPAIGQEHALAATNLAVGSPSLGEPGIDQDQALDASSLAVGSPEFGSPTLAEVVSLTATDLVVDAPNIGAPALTQAHALTAIDLASSSLGFGEPAIGQEHGLAADDLAVSSPVFGTPLLGLTSLVATDLIVGSPVLGVVALGVFSSLPDVVIGRRALTYVEIDVPTCSLVYGLTPCQAMIGVTGTKKCFNTLKTCQDRDSYSEQLVTLRYARPTAYLPAEIDCIPSIRDVSFSPAAISLGESIGQRASVTVKLGDHRHSDAGDGYDPYFGERTYNPWEQGSYWGKFRARQPFLRGRALRLIHGYLGDAISDMETRHFLLESFDGPSIDGEFKLVAKDVLKLADGDRAQAPRLSNGFLVADITDSATTATLSPSGIGNDEYPSSGHVSIGGQEICSFTRSADVLTLTRAQLGTAAQTHSAQDRVQVVLRYASQDPADIIHDLLTTYTETLSSWITLADWQDETGDFLGTLYTATIGEPTSVNELISELVEQAALAIWWDDLAQKIRLQVLRGIVTTAASYDDDLIIARTLKVSEQPSKRLSRVQTYFGQINPLRPLSDLDNYRSSVETIDTDAESDYGSIAQRRVLSRWIPALGRSVAEKYNQKQLSRFRDPPRRFTFEILRGAPATAPVHGGGYQMRSHVLQDDTGAQIDVPIQVTKLTPTADTLRVEADEMLFLASDDDLPDRLIIIDVNTNNVNLRTVHDALYPTPQSGDSVTCRINAGVIVGSESTTLYALDVGEWPSGVSVTLELNGRIQGKGGQGGNGGATLGGHTAGTSGGPALYTREAINVEYGVSAEIWGGGGGGGGGIGALVLFVPVGGGAGGGGAGTNAGPRGVDGPNASVVTAGTDGSATTGGSGTDVSSATDGGDGGGPGLAGAASSAAGGAAGDAIDGVSYLTVVSGSADIRGGQVN